MADEEKRLPEEESSASLSSAEETAAPEQEKAASAQAEPEKSGESVPAAEEDQTIAGRRTKGFKLDLGKRLADIPEYTLTEDAGKLRKKRRKSTFARVMMGIIIVGVSALLSMTIIFGAQDIFGFAKADRVVTVDVPQNAGLTEIAEILEEKGVVNSGLLFRAYYKFSKPSGEFHVGTYALNSNMSYSMILTELFKYGASREEVSVTFPEGFTLYQMAKRLEEKGVCRADEFITAANTMDFGFAFEKELTDDPLKYHKLEGFLFPDTYFFFKDDNPANVIKKMLANYEKKMKPEYLARMQELGLSQEETIRLASIVQREAGKTKEMEKVSSVYHNRLAKAGTYPLLQADPTRGYARELREQMGTNTNQTILDAYDTYKSSGLPPGAICNPGEDAIKATLYPAETGYYFFCSNLTTGKFYYAVTYDEHQANLRKAGLT